MMCSVPRTLEQAPKPLSGHTINHLGNQSPRSANPMTGVLVVPPGARCLLVRDSRFVSLPRFAARIGPIGFHYTLVF